MNHVKSLEANIWKYALFLITNKRIVAPILGAYYLTIPDVTVQSIGLLLLVGQGAGFFLEIPSGYASDKLGHKHALVISRALMVLSTFLFLIASNLFLLILGSLFLSAAAAFQSGTTSAFMHETLRALGREHEYSEIVGKASSLGFAVPIFFMAFVPFLVETSYKAPFLIALVIDAIGLIVAASFVVPPVPQETIEEIGATNFRSVLREAYRLNFFSLAFFSGIVSGIMFAVAGFRAAYQLSLEVPVIWYGVLFGVGRALASLLLAYSGKIKQWFTLPSFYLFQIMLYATLILLLGVTKNIWIVLGIFMLSNGFQWGLTKIDEGYQLSTIRGSKFKATLLSVSSQIDLIVGALASLFLGFMADRFSYAYGFIFLGIAFLLLTLPLFFSISRKYTKGIYPH